MKSRLIRRVPRRSPIAIFTVIVVGFLVGALIGVMMLFPSQPQGPARVQTSGKALVGGPFKLIDQSGKEVTDRDFRGRYMLVFFGFTHCPDICPAELQVMSAALDRLGDKANKVVPIFITLDPDGTISADASGIVVPGGTIAAGDYTISGQSGNLVQVVLSADGMPAGLTLTNFTTLPADLSNIALSGGSLNFTIGADLTVDSGSVATGNDQALNFTIAVTYN